MAWPISGMLLISLDGRVLPAHGVFGTDVGNVYPTVSPPFPIPSLAVALGMDAPTEAQFRKWLALVAARHAEMRWEKLSALSPVQILDPARGERGSRPMRLEFRLIEGMGGKAVALAAFGLDAYPSSPLDPASDSYQSMARQLEQERVRHGLQIRDFLALSANPPETVGAFLADAANRLDNSLAEWGDYLAANAYPEPVSPTENPHPSLAPNARPHQSIAPNAEPHQSIAPAAGALSSLVSLWTEGNQDGGVGARLFREKHMLKGNAGAFGFDGLAASVQESEEYLEATKGTHVAPADLKRLADGLAGLKTHLEEIRRAMKLVSGEGQEAMARILKWKLDRLHTAAASLDGKALDPRLRALVDQSLHLPYLSPAYLARKYRNLVERLASGQNKKVRFRIASNTGEIHPESFSRMDEALVHILRNMVDHGIESPRERQAAGKPEAEISLEYVDDESRVTLRVRDNGRGMDPSRLAERAIALGILDPTEAANLQDAQKLSLIFQEGFTTRDRTNLVSGRGLGLALAARGMADLGGTVAVASEAGKGTCFTLVLPPLS